MGINDPGFKSWEGQEIFLSSKVIAAVRPTKPPVERVPGSKIARA
jgi:hypothetical protein